MYRLGKRVIALFLCCVMLFSVTVSAFAEAEDLELTVDSYSTEEGSFTLKSDAQFFVITTENPDDTFAETLKLISSEFAAAGKPG